MTTIEYSKKQVARDYRFWIKDHPNGTLGELLAKLNKALDQCRKMVFFTNDARIEDYWDDIPTPLYSQLAEWDNTDEECTFSCRESDIEDHYWEVEELVNKLGADFKTEDLVK